MRKLVKDFIGMISTYSWLWIYGNLRQEKGKLIFFPEVKLLCNDKYIRLKSKIKKKALIA